MYTATTLNNYAAVPLLIAASTLLIQTDKRAQIVAQLLFICSVFSLYITYAGGDDLAAFPVGRLLLPVIFILMLLAASSLNAMFQRRQPKQAIWAAVLISAFMALQQTPMDEVLGREANPSLAYHNLSARHAVLEGISNKIKHPGQVEPSPISEWILAHTAPDDFIAIGGAGRIPYYTDRPTIDMNGLNDTHIAHTAGKERGIVTKGDPDYVIARRPKVIFLTANADCPGNDTPNSICLSRQADKHLLDLLNHSNDYHFSATFPWPGGSKEWSFVRNN